MKQTGTTSTEDGLEAMAGGPGAGSETLLQVDLWTDSGGDLPASAVGLVSDLLAAEGDEVHETAPGLLAASFRSTAHAVTAARHIQRLATGYSRASAAVPLRSCVTLTRVQEAGNGDGPRGLQQAHTGQVLLVGGICEAARSIPGLQFAELAEGLRLLPPVHMEGYVDEALEITAPIEVSAPAPEVEEAAWEQVAEPPAAMQPEATMPVRGTSAAWPAASVSAGREAEGKPGVPRWAIFGVAGVVVAAIVAAVVVFSHSSSSHSAPAPEQIAAPANVEGPALAPAAPPPAGPAKAQSPAKQAGVAATQQKAPDGNAAGSATGPAAGSAGSAVPAPAAEEPAAEPAEPQGNVHGITYTAAEITSLIARAQKDSGNGNYDRAILEFRTVLNQDPSNAEAKQGLARALYNQSHR
jgi:hypothetical protein